MDFKIKWVKSVCCISIRGECASVPKMLGLTGLIEFWVILNRVYLE